MTTQADVSLQIVNKLKGLVANRVYRRVIPQSSAAPVLPAITYQYISAIPTQDVCGDGGEEVADYRIQINVWDLESKGPTAFETLCRQVRAAMAELNPLVVWDGQTDLDGEELKASGVALDYFVYLSTP